LLDVYLAALYGVTTKRLNEQVRRNRARFTEGFMFQLTAEKIAPLRSQFATSNKGRGGRRYAPYAFTEQGVAMLSTVLNSERAIQVNIEIMRALLSVFDRYWLQTQSLHARWTLWRGNTTHSSK
jgi:hypothetical protein